ncbi:tectonic [Cochliomyia hominivorax]
MVFKKLFLCHILWLIIESTVSLKIGISKPLPLTTTMAPNTTIVETTTEEATTEIDSSTSIPLITTTTSTTTTSEPEWPEFPPKKSTKTHNIITTKKPSTTTIKPTTTTSTTTIAPPEATNATTVTDPTDSNIIPTSSPKWPIKQKFCFCDLSKDLCDINCCCDSDCSVETLKVFRCENEQNNELELIEGRFEDFKFQHGLPSCEVNDGWLCVFRTYKPAIKEEMTNSFDDTSRFNKWPNLLLESEEIKTREFYKYGDILRIANMETKEIDNFDLPSSFQSSSCQLQEPIYHLKSIKRSCLITSLENLKEIQHKLQHLQDNYKIFRKPNIPDDLNYNKNLEQYFGNITLNACYESFRNCSKYERNLEIHKKVELFKVKINILHNFTNIQEVVIELYLRDNENLHRDLWLIYEVEFYNKTSKEFSATYLKSIKPVPIQSGPLGYLPGKPIIIARLEAFNKSLPLSNKNQIINYFSPNNTEPHTLSLFTKENGECKRLDAAKDFINYGINIAKYCKIKFENNTELWEDSKKSNFTQICLRLQQRINEQLFGQDLIITDLTSYYISSLGNPENNTHKWLPLQVFNTDFDTVVGQYLHETNTFVCRNILLSLNYEFHMSTTMVNGVDMQNVIKHAALHLAERHDLEFALDEILEVPITMTVRFYDVHEKAVSAAFSLRNFNLVYSFLMGLILVIF